MTCDVCLLEVSRLTRRLDDTEGLFYCVRCTNEVNIRIIRKISSKIKLLEKAKDDNKK